MTEAIARPWDAKRTEESRTVEEILKEAGFEKVDAYRYNLASIRVRVVDPRFEGLSFAERLDLVEPSLDGLPERTQADIITLLAFTPTELEPISETLARYPSNAEFEEQSP